MYNTCFAVIISEIKDWGKAGTQKERKFFVNFFEKRKGYLSGWRFFLYTVKEFENKRTEREEKWSRDYDKGSHF
jgi:hypothetical protein